MALATISLNLGEFIEQPNGMLSIDDPDVTLDTGLLGDIWQEACSRNHVRGYYPLVSGLESKPYRVFRKELEELGGTSLVLYQELQGKAVEVDYTNGRLVMDKALIGVDNLPSMLESLLRVPRCKVKGILSKGVFYATEYVEENFDFATVLSNLEYLVSLGFDVVPYNSLDVFSVEELDELFLATKEEDDSDSMGMVLRLNDLRIARDFTYDGLWIPYKMLSTTVYKGYIQFVSWSEDINGILRPFAFVSDVQDVARFQGTDGSNKTYFEYIQEEGFVDIVSNVTNLDELGVRTAGARVIKYVPLHNIATMVKLEATYQKELYFRVYKGLVFPTDEKGMVLFDTFDI